MRCRCFKPKSEKRRGYFAKVSSGGRPARHHWLPGRLAGTLALGGTPAEHPTRVARVGTRRRKAPGSNPTGHPNRVPGLALGSVRHRAAPWRQVAPVAFGAHARPTRPAGRWKRPRPRCYRFVRVAQLRQPARCAKGAPGGQKCRMVWHSHPKDPATKKGEALDPQNKS